MLNSYNTRSVWVKRSGGECELTWVPLRTFGFESQSQRVTFSWNLACSPDNSSTLELTNNVFRYCMYSICNQSKMQKKYNNNALLVPNIKWLYPIILICTPFQVSDLSSSFSDFLSDSCGNVTASTPCARKHNVDPFVKMRFLLTKATFRYQMNIFKESLEP